MTVSRIAWFSPLPASTSGIASYSAEILPRLAADDFAIDSFSETNAHDFVWKQRRNHYDLTVFQLGNASCHDFMWAYLFRYPGLVVLHDAQLHQARALYLTKRWKPRRADYLAEFRANHPEAPPDVGHLIAAGLGGSLYHHWPLVRLVIESARLTVVHNGRLADALRLQHPTARIEAIEMGVADLEASPAGREQIRRRHRLPPDAIVLAAFGGVTPEKRIPQLIRALGTIVDRHPRLHLLLVGAPARHYDVMADAVMWGIADRVHLTGYVPDDQLCGYLLAADFCSCLRWPTNRETSASWLRCLAASRPTIITDLTHLANLPTLDPRGWQVLALGDDQPPVAVSIDLLDEEHSLQLAIERLATDLPLRQQLGEAGRVWWAAHHQLDTMAEGYRRVIAAATTAPLSGIELPSHLLDDGSGLAKRLVAELGVGNQVGDLLA